MQQKLFTRLGFPYPSSEHDKIRKKAASILSMSKYLLETYKC